MAAVQPHDLSILSLVLAADPVVKAVMASLVLASVWSWAVALEKMMLFGALKMGGRRFEEKFWSGASLDELENADGPGADAFARVLSVGAREWREARRQANMSEAQARLVQERCDRVLGAAISREVAKAGKGLGILASIGSSAPFIGLFGTVWGIMNSFSSIAASNETSLAVVAPGIAEALFATALGLAAAIPAVLFFNKFTTDLDQFGDQLENLADEFAARLSRRIEERVG